MWQAVHRAKPFTWRCSVTCTCKLTCSPKHSGSLRSSKTNSGGIRLKCGKLLRSITTLTSGAEIRSWRFECCGVFAWWEYRRELTLQRDQWGTLLLSQGVSWGLVWPHHAPCCVQRWKENKCFWTAPSQPLWFVAASFRLATRGRVAQRQASSWFDGPYGTDDELVLNNLNKENACVIIGVSLIVSLEGSFWPQTWRLLARACVCDWVALNGSNSMWHCH